MFISLWHHAEEIGTSVLQGVDTIKCLFLLATKHQYIYIYIYVIYLVYLTPLHVLGVQPSSGRTWIQKKHKGERPVLTNSRYKIIIIIIVLKVE
jgi:hypothetical protein